MGGLAGRTQFFNLFLSNQRIFYMFCRLLASNCCFACVDWGNESYPVLFFIGVSGHQKQLIRSEAGVLQLLQTFCFSFRDNVFVADIYCQRSSFFLSNEIDFSFIFPVVDFITPANEFQKNQIFRQWEKGLCRHGSIELFVNTGFDSSS